MDIAIAFFLVSVFYLLMALYIEFMGGSDDN